MAAKIYNPHEAPIVVNKVPILSGFADGEFLSWTNNADLIERVAGTDGEQSLSRNLDRSIEVTIKLMETGEANIVFSELWDVQQASGGIASFDFLYRDINTLEELIAGEAFLMKLPDGSKDRQASSREWGILLPNPRYAYVA